MLYKTVFNTPGRRLGYHFADLESMRQRMDQLFEAFGNRPSSRSGAGVFPAINITENADTYTVSAELPGLTSEDLDLNVTANQLTMAGERKITPEGEEVHYHRREREAGSFSRAIALPGDVDPDRTKARLVDGVLTITVPKAESAKPKQISVQSFNGEG